MKTGLARTAVAGVLCALLGAGVVHAEDQQVAREYTANVALDVDGKGQVTGVALPAEVPAMLTGPAQEAMKQWRFKPPVRDGHAVTARTYARTSLQAKLFIPPPRYPMEELRHRSEGSLIMEAIVHPDGTLTDIRMVKHHFSDVHFSAFQQSVMTALAHCPATPELVNGKPVATRIRIPFTFKLNYVSRADALSTPVKREADRGPAGDSESSAPADEVVALDSPVQPLEGNPHS